MGSVKAVKTSYLILVKQASHLKADNPKHYICNRQPFLNVSFNMSNNSLHSCCPTILIRKNYNYQTTFKVFPFV